MPPNNTDIEIKHLLEKNTELLRENNVLLKKIHRHNVIGAWFKLLWFVVLIGLPFALYFYVLEPYFTALGSSYEIFSAGMQEIPGWKNFIQTLEAVKANRYGH